MWKVGTALNAKRCIWRETCASDSLLKKTVHVYSCHAGARVHLGGSDVSLLLAASCIVQLAVLLVGKVSMSRKAIAQLIGKVCSSMACGPQQHITMILNWLLAAP